MSNQKRGKLLATGFATALTVSLATAFFGAPEQASTANVERQFAPSAMTFSFGDERTVIATAEPAVAAPASVEKAKTRDSLYREADGTVTVSDDRSTNSTGMVRVSHGGDLFPQGRALPAAEKSSAFLERHGSVFGITDVSRELRIIGMNQDQYGNSRVTYQQMHGDVPVFGVVLHSHISEDGRLTAVNGKFVADIDVPSTPSINPDYAAHSAVARVSRQLPGRIKNADLDVVSTSVMVYRENLTKGTTGANHLAYQVEVTHGNAIRELVYVDALTGKVVDQITGMQSNHPTVKHREVYEAAYTPGSPAWQEGTIRPAPGGGFAHEDHVAGAGESYNIFLNLTSTVGTSDGYRSYDGANHVMASVNNDPTIVCPNANWNGTTTNYCSATASDDVVTHEWTHAYTQHVSGLIYSYQSGALNESYSDLMGEAVDLINNRDSLTPVNDAILGGNDGPRVPNSCSNFASGSNTGDNSYRWLMGEDAYSFVAFGTPPPDAAIRDLWRPSCLGDADYVNAPNYHCAASDGGGVHSNSSINNRAFALLVDGQGNLSNSNATPAPNDVVGIGLTKATHIFWRANSVYNTPSTNFNDNANSLEAACQDLKGSTLTKLVTTDEDGTGSTGDNNAGLGIPDAPPYDTYNNDTIHPVAEAFDGINILNGNNMGAVITDADCDQVTNAIAAVEMRFDVTQKCNFNTMFVLEDAPRCGVDADGVPVDATLNFLEGWDDATENVPNAGDWTTPKGTWETGIEFVSVGKTPGGNENTDTWTIVNGDYSFNGKDGTVPNNSDGTLHGGYVMYQENRVDFGNCASDDESGRQWLDSPDITLHATETSYAVVEHYMSSEFTYDGGNILISTNGGTSFTTVPPAAIIFNSYVGPLASAANQNTNPKAGQAAWHGGNQGESKGDWGQTQIDLIAAGAAVGDTIQLRFEFGQDGCNGADGWYVDDVEVFSCPGDIIDPPPPPGDCLDPLAFDAVVSIPNDNLITFGVPSITTATVPAGQDARVTDIYDVNVRSLDGNHTYIGDIVIDLTAPNGVPHQRDPAGVITVFGINSVNLFDGGACGGETWNSSLDLDDEAGATIACNDLATGGSFKPVEALNNFDGLNGEGDWTLTIHDFFPIDDGGVNGWKIEFCREPVTNANRQPIARDDFATTTENTPEDTDTPIVLDVVAGVGSPSDEDPDGQYLTVTNVSSANFGTVAIVNDHEVSYLPEEGYCNYDTVNNVSTGPLDTFSYTIDDGQGESNSTDDATVHMQVNCVPDDEEEGDDADSVKGNGKLRSLHVSNDDDSDSDSHNVPHDDSDSDSRNFIKFHFDPKRKKKNDELKGHLHLDDKEADVKIHMKEITYLGPVIGACGDIDNGDDGTYIIEFQGVGTYEQGDIKIEDAVFRACTVDADPLDTKKDDGKTVKGGDADRFHLECTKNCTYNTEDRVDPDDVLDDGDVRIKLEQ